MPLIRRGAGEKIVLLHGYLSRKESFYYQIKFLENYYTVIAPDLPGFGASPPLTQAYSVGDYAIWLEKFFKVQGIEGAYILAHSFGARVSFKLLSRRPKLCKKLIITGGAGIVKPRTPQYMRKVRRYRRVKKLFPKFAERHFGSPEYRTLSPIMRESYKKIVNEDLSDCCKKITCPTLLIYGKDDTVTPPDEEGKIFSELIADSRLKLTDGGHFCFSEHPERFNAEIFNFLREE